MDIIIKEQSPDGLNITINNIVVDTYVEASKLLEMIDKQIHRSKLELTGNINKIGE